MRFNLPFVQLTGFFVLLLASSAHGQTAPGPSRYLLVLDVSAPMKPRAEAVQETVTGLFASGIRGELKNGDEIGIWTFNDQLHTGDFEMVIWNESDSNEITREILEFIRSRRYANQTRFETVRPELLELIGDSRRITVVLISDGDEVIQGTPFDLQIKRYFQDNATELKQKQVPIITVLRGYKGRLVSHGCSHAPWPVELPPFPKEPEASQETISEKSQISGSGDVSSTLAKTNKGPVIYAQPLIVSGKTNQSPPPVKAPPNITNSAAIDAAPDTVGVTAAHPEAMGGSLSENQAASTTATNVEPASPARTDPDAVSTQSESEEMAGQGFWSPLKLVAFGVPCVVLVAGAFLLRRKPRSRGHTSLITRSMDKRPRRRPPAR